MFIVLQLRATNNPYLIVIIHGTHHNHRFVNRGPIDIIMSHGIGGELQEIILDPLFPFGFIRLFEVNDRNLSFMQTH